MADAEPSAAACAFCLEAPGDHEGLCGPCYWATVDQELSCDWLPDEEPQR